MSKKNWFLGLVLIAFFSSCNRHYSRFAGSFNRQKEAGQNFVVTRDGNKISSDEVKERSPLFSKSVLRLDDGTKIPVKDVVAYQNDEGYFARLNNTGGLLKRVHKGSLDIYQKISISYSAPTYSTNTIGMGRWSGGGSTTQVAYYLKKGVNGEAVLMHGSNGRKIFDLVSDYAPSAELMERFNKKRKQLKTISYINWTGAAGGLIMIIAARTPGSGTANVGGGLLLGSMVSGLVNMIRKGNNNNRLFEAISEYNIKR